MDIILGTAGFAKQYGINNDKKPSKPEIARMLDTAKANGIKILDTADSYENYDLIAEAGFKIITKFSLDGQTIDQCFIKTAEQINQLPLCYLFHREKDFVNFSDWEMVDRLKIPLGTSVYSDSALHFSWHYPRIKMTQLPVNLLDCSERKLMVLRQMIKKGKKIHARSIFLQGIFFSLPEKLKELQPAIDELTQIARSEKLTLPELALSLVLSLKDELSGIVIGANSEDELKAFFKMNTKTLGKKTIEKIQLVKKPLKLNNPLNWAEL